MSDKAEEQRQHLQKRMDLFAEWKRMSDSQRRDLHQWWLNSRDNKQDWGFTAFSMSTSTLTNAMAAREKQQ